VIGAATLLLFYVLAIATPWLAPYPQDAIDFSVKFAPPSPAHLLGTDQLGRDTFTRMLYGSQVSLVTSLLAVAISVFVGVSVGLAAGYTYGGRLDAVLTRMTEGMQAVPALFLGLVALSVFDRSIWTVIAVIGLLRWVVPARVVRSEIIKYRDHEFVTAARSIGVSDLRILWRHLFPQTLPTTIVTVSFGVAQAILMESALSYLGLGIQPPYASWGNMLTGAQNYVFTNPLLAVFPGVAIFVTVLAYNSVGDALRDALDPRLVHRA
jgi:peptide/nickel transport system permease protein